MKIKITLLFFWIISLLAFTSCKKSSTSKTESSNNTSNNAPATPPSGALITWNEVDSSSNSKINTLLNYQYNSSGELITVVQSNGSLKMVFGYNSNNLSVSYSSSLNGNFTKTGEIDSQGRLTKLSDDVADYQTFQYSSDGYLIGSQIYEANTLAHTFSFTYVNSNLVTIDDRDPSTNHLYQELDFTYTSDPAIKGVDFALTYLLPPLGGFPAIYSSNLLGKQSSNSLQSLVGSYTLTYTYSGNQVTQINISNSQKINLTYAP